MKIKNANGFEVEMSSEELRHFKLNSAGEVKKFLDTLEPKKGKLGFAKNGKIKEG